MRTREEAGQGKRAGMAAKSRQFWELKAEQVLNKIFDHDAAALFKSGLLRSPRSVLTPAVSYTDLPQFHAFASRLQRVCQSRVLLHA